MVCLVCDLLAADWDAVENHYQLQYIRSLGLLFQSSRHDRLCVLQISTVKAAAYAEQLCTTGDTLAIAAKPLLPVPGL
jgi:hypothetical protein